ncbi:MULTISPECIES: type II toxin-antitoxin system death-on-curing family toxin [Bacillus]|uniref:type II toxin-antitoxin system death-on-curing family toxin n=1 Tax=Bacillus TaxID=1386 RepID=UPI0022805F3A|nr:type II toxin-antitoxin system death-on-curing family toxin [Bacillus safensis]MCY7479590.1 type II toxin-antitoxin system death-on-curing family toxin [Bacillus safensis]MCY7513911.1 type II toxin-antitoxin system death-on-curing family toxin [Bacillus safensis]MED0719337.1 type II toxin-antitoxin system death-on-curing family toxin [Bacillus safensis]MED4746616.1 type II toxin-antitoxin system death-on-curing family toxin [Bacillus safensis]
MEETLHLNQDINYLIHEDIIQAYKLGYHEFGGTSNKVYNSCVEKRVVEPQTHFFGVEQYPGLFKKAAVYMYRITISHCFGDGNKRAAILSTDLFLKINGFEFKVSDDELYDFVYAVADHKTRPTLEEVEEWIQLNVQPYILNQEELSEFL